MSSFIGKRIHQDKYVVERELGRGGFGITYKAINTSLNQSVVIKTLNDALRQNPNFLNHQQQFQDEARRLAKCVHPSIVRVSDFFIEEDLPFIVMDYVPGQTLDVVILPNNPLPEEAALHYIQQVGDAVRTVHQNGLLHRDIKPQNLILREGTQQIVLIDFGIAREFNPGLTQTHTGMVSAGYAPIEQYLPQARRSPATDIYGLAATLYTLLTGKVPIAAPLRDRSPLLELRQLLPGVSASLNEAVMRGMAMDPLHRPATVEAWLALLQTGATHTFVAPVVGSTSQATTVAVEPVHRASHPKYTQATTVALATPTIKVKSQRQWWLPALVIFGTLVPLGLGYSLWRPQTSSTGQPTTADTPTSPEVFESPLPLEDSVRPSEASPLPPDAAPSVPFPSDAIESDATSAPLAPPPSARPTEEDTNPAPQQSEQSREAQRREEKRAREEEKRREQQAREEEKRREQRARGERRGRRND